MSSLVVIGCMNMVDIPCILMFFHAKGCAMLFFLEWCKCFFSGAWWMMDLDRVKGSQRGPLALMRGLLVAHGTSYERDFLCHCLRFNFIWPINKCIFELFILLLNRLFNSFHANLTSLMPAI